MKKTAVHSVGQYNVLVFQNEGSEALVNFLQDHYFNAWYVTEEDIAAEIALGKMDLAILDYYKKYSKEKDLTLLNSMQRYYPNIPVILCVEDDSPAATIAAYDAGAYDVIHKPYNLEELIRKLRVFLRFAPLKHIELKEEVKIHDFVLNAKDRTFFDGSKTIMLTERELSVFMYFFSCPNQLVTSAIILNAIWHQVDAFTKRTLDFYVAKFRKYLAPDPTVHLVTITNRGYLLRIEKPQQ